MSKHEFEFRWKLRAETVDPEGEGAEGKIKCILVTACGCEQVKWLRQERETIKIPISRASKPGIYGDMYGDMMARREVFMERVFVAVGEDPPGTVIYHERIND